MAGARGGAHLRSQAQADPAYEATMALNAQKVRDALVGLGPMQPVFVDPPANFHVWMAEKRLPADVVEFLLRTAVSENVPFPSGSGGMWPPNDIMDLNEQEAAMLRSDLLAVGNSTNGDFIVIDLRQAERQAGFVSHDELWEGLFADTREIFAPVADSLDEMLASMSEDHWNALRSDSYEWGRYPRDYCDALSWPKPDR